MVYADPRKSALGEVIFIPDPSTRTDDKQPLRRVNNPSLALLFTGPSDLSVTYQRTNTINPEVDQVSRLAFDAAFGGQRASRIRRAPSQASGPSSWAPKGRSQNWSMSRC